ncbi:MAG: hypothetical protein QXU32_02250 [Nitrososphaerales archaeon]
MNTTFWALLMMDALFLWVLIKTKGWWLPKFIAMIVVLSFNLFVIDASRSFQGWPTKEALPRQSQFVSCIVREPIAEQDGIIYLWVIPFAMKYFNPFAYDTVSGDPRAYAFPYTRAMHENCVTATKKVMMGMKVFIERGVKAKDKKKVDDNRPRGEWSRQTDMKFYELPPGEPRRKNYEN